MKAKLKVLKGPSAGKEIDIPVAKFFIGRGEDCHLRPKSEAISRHHCVIIVSDAQVAIKDFGSKNGTFLNNKRIENVAILNNGDQLIVGPLSFEIVLDHSLGGTKKPKIQGVADVAKRSAGKSREIDSQNDDSIAGWLEESLFSDADMNTSDTVTRQFVLEDTNSFDKPAEVTQDSEEEQGPEDLEDSKKHQKRKPMKLPERIVVKDEAEDSTAAASDMLRKYFNR